MSAVNESDVILYPISVALQSLVGKGNDQPFASVEVERDDSRWWLKVVEKDGTVHRLTEVADEAASPSTVTLYTDGVYERESLLALPGAHEVPAPMYAEWRIDGLAWNAVYYPKNGNLVLQGKRVDVAAAACQDQPEGGAGE